MIELCGVTKRYRSGEEWLTVLNDVHLRVEAGEFVSIMGPSGSGKSTLMHILGCLDTPTSGSYRLFGRPIEQLTAHELARIRNQEIGFVFQNFHLIPRMTAEKNVELPMVYAGVPRWKRRERARFLLQQVGLLDRAHHFPNALSGGQKQRVAIARALANHPVLLLADEPTGALDSVTGQEIMELFQALNADGMTVIVITHDADVAKMAHRIIRISDGRLMDDSARGVAHEPWGDAAFRLDGHPQQQVTLFSHDAGDSHRGLGHHRDCGLRSGRSSGRHRDN